MSCYNNWNSVLFKRALYDKIEKKENNLYDWTVEHAVF